MDEFKNVNDVIAIRYSSEFGDKKIIWKNPDTNILYMNGYENEPISMLVGIMFYFHNKTTPNDITRAINTTIDNFIINNKRTLCMFVENDIDKVIDTALAACQEGIILNSDQTKEIESNWIYSPFCDSVWKYHNYINKIIDEVKLHF